MQNMHVAFVEKLGFRAKFSGTIATNFASLLGSLDTTSDALALLLRFGNAKLPKAPTKPNMRGTRRRPQRQQFSDELQFQAGLPGLRVTEQAGAKAFRQLRQNIERSIEGVDGLVAAYKLYRAEVDKIFVDQVTRVATTIKGDFLATVDAIKGEAEGIIGILGAQDAEIERLQRDRETREAERDGPTASANREIKRLQEQRDATIHELQLTGMKRLTLEAEFARLIEDQRDIIHKEQMRMTMERAAQNRELAASLYEKQITDAIGVQAELAEQQQAAFEASLGEDERLAGFQAFDQTTLSIIENADRAIASIEGISAIMEIASNSSLTGVQKVSAGLDAMQQISGGLISNVKTRAAVLGAFEVAKAAADAADLNFLGAALHGLAAAKFFALSGSGKGRGSSTSTRREKRQRTRLSSNDVGGGLRNQQRRQQTIVNIVVNPVDGRAQVEALNELGRVDPNVQINQNLFRAVAGPSGF